jgi:hypothetical protein
VTRKNHSSNIKLMIWKYKSYLLNQFIIKLILIIPR